MRRWFLVVSFFAFSMFTQPISAAEFEFGFSKVDITPTAPVRLSGYGNRAKPYAGIDEQLFARAMAMTTDGKQGLHVLVSVDTIGFPGVLTKDIHDAVKKKHNIPRSRFVICCTHSHTAPHIGRGLSNLYSVPQTEVEIIATEAYTTIVRNQVIKAVDEAIADLQPGQLSTSSGEVTFARNRRVLKDGIWSGFGENPSGPVDHSLPVLRITDDSGKTRGLLFNYACHCTTFGGDYNRVNGDWAAYATKYLEEANEGAIALCTIGCGADANPERNREHAFEISQRQGKEISDEVTRLVDDKKEMAAISAPPSASFGYAGLPSDRPSDAEMREGLKSTRQQVRKHAEVMIDTKKRMGRLPETYPMPIQVWRFGNEFAMVFLGGEVCVDYALRIKKELPQLVPGLSPDKVWVTAYANDVFAYVAPERMRAEGGYEVDFSMIYYLLPGRWSTGTEEVIIRRVKELVGAKDLDVPLSINDALKTFSVPDGFEIDVIAAEPLIRDPVNFAVDAQGRLWVVEMGDYPRGNPEEDLSKIERHEPWDGPAAGRIKVLVDKDGDGTYDAATTFLSGLSFPTGVSPWKDGVLICGAPDIIFARDTDGDLKCDETEVLYSGFEESNPQHRIGGFEHGLDGWLYLSAGTNNREITCVKTGEKVNISGRDCRIHPESGRLEPVSGSSQYGRSRDDFGNWYGNSNSYPLFQFVIEDRDLSRNPHVASPSPMHHLTEPARAPPVYPTSRSLDRFNDLWALDRFTSACSPTVFRNDTLGSDVYGSVLICEPVHNLVSRVNVDTSTIEFTGKRHAGEQNSEFLSSTDNWFRPVRLMTAPDGSLWVCDMYRHVIEHPEWIPEAWQAKLDLYAGYNRGRIYRISRKESPPTAIENLSKLDTKSLVAKLESPNGWTRDTAQRLIVERTTEVNPEVNSAIHQLVNETEESRCLVQAGHTLALLPGENPGIRKLYRSADPNVVINALRIWGAESNLRYKWQPLILMNDPSERIRFELALAAGDANPDDRIRILRRLIETSSDNLWIRTAILSSTNNVAGQLLVAAIQQGNTDPKLLNSLLATLIGNDPVQGLEQLGKSLKKLESEHLKRQLLLTALEYLERQNISFADASKNLSERSSSYFQNLINDAAESLNEKSLPASQIPQALQLTSFVEGVSAEEVALSFLDPSNPPEVVTAAIESVLRLKATKSLLKQMSRHTPVTQAEIQAIILTDAGALAALLKALEKQSTSLSDLSVATRDALSNHRQSEIKKRFQEITKLEPTRPSRTEVLEAFHPALSLKGDSLKGRELFKKVCSSCHKHLDVGNDFGPKLATLASKPDDYLLTAILDPNAAAEAKYRGYSIATKDGKVYSGLIFEETATSLKLIRPDGKSETILRVNIEEMVNTGRSFMPEGLEKDHTPQDVADIIAFIRSE